MNVLVIGDVIGKPGRTALKRHLRRLRDEHAVSFVVANAENSAGGAGVTPETAEEMFAFGVDCLTSGNHIWDKKEVIPYIDREPRLLRPANYPPPCPGSGLYVGTTEEGFRIAVINLMGRVYMGNYDDPLRTADQLLREERNRSDAVVVDIHAELTSEKGAMGCYLDGRVGLVYGTHTHIPTADERILPGGTAFQTDVGMTGPFDSIIGVEKDAVLQRFLTQRHIRFSPAEKDIWLNATLVGVDETTGLALDIRRVTIRNAV